MPFIEAQSLKIHYRTGGAGLTPIVFLHGNYASSRWWEPMLACVPGGYYTLAPDLRGCGSRQQRTTWTGLDTQQISIEILAQDQASYLQALEIEQAVFVGHSLGGLVAITLAMQHPDRVLALVLEDIGPAGGIPFGPAAIPLLLPLELKNRMMLRRALRRAGIPPSGPLAAALVEDALSAPRGLYYQFARAAAAWKAGGRLNTIAAPVMLVWGQEDRVMPHRYAATYLQALPDPQIVLIPGAGHSPHLERPVQFEEILYDFLDKQFGGDRDLELKRAD